MSRSKSSQNSKSKDKTKNVQYFNYLTVSNGCRIISDIPKPLAYLNPQNILTQNQHQVWLCPQLPASCIIDMRNLIQKPTYFNRVGFRCWHQYSSNPKFIQISYSQDHSPENARWKILTKISMTLIDGWQHFKTPLLMMKNLSLLKIKILSNHSESTQSDISINNDQQESHNVGISDIKNKRNQKSGHFEEQRENFQYNANFNPENLQSMTYLNQVSLGFVEEIIESRVQNMSLTNNQNDKNNSIHNMREKTFSDFRKSVPNQRQLKKINEKLNQLTNENQVMKSTIHQQNQLILKLQNTLNMLVENVQKLQKVQNIQNNKIKELQNKNNFNLISGSKNKKIYKFKGSQQNNTVSSDISQKQPNRQKQRKYKNSIHKNNNKNSIHSTNKRHSQYSRQRSQQLKQNSYSRNKQLVSGKKPSSYKIKQEETNKRRIVVDPNVNESDELSEYGGMAVNRIKRNTIGYNGNKDKSQEKQKGYIPMLQKLQQLIMLRDQKKNRLLSNKKTTHKKASNMKRVIGEDEGQSIYSDEESGENEYQSY